MILVPKGKIRGFLWIFLQILTLRIKIKRILIFKNYFQQKTKIQGQKTKTRQLTRIKRPFKPLYNDLE